MKRPKLPTSPLKSSGRPNLPKNIGGFPKIRGTLFGGPHNKDCIFLVLYWDPPIEGNYHLNSTPKGPNLQKPQQELQNCLPKRPIPIPKTIDYSPNSPNRLPKRTRPVLKRKAQAARASQNIQMGAEKRKAQVGLPSIGSKGPTWPRKAKSPKWSPNDSNCPKNPKLV